jgi:DNA-binding response OmpR family regulator
MAQPYRILVLDDDEHALTGIVELLQGAAYDVTGARSYEDANRLLGCEPFDLFITDVRLRGFNGLHLVMRIRVERRDMAVIILSGYEEALMELEARRYQATFLRKPLHPVRFLETVAASLAGVRRQRRWPRTRVGGGFRVLAAGQPAAVVEVSYGGLRLEVPAGTPLPDRFAVELSGTGLQLLVQPVSSGASANLQQTVCCAALASADPSIDARWRVIVDRLGGHQG